MTTTAAAGRRARSTCCKRARGSLRSDEEGKFFYRRTFKVDYKNAILKIRSTEHRLKFLEMGSLKIRNMTPTDSQRSEVLAVTVTADESEHSVTSVWFERGMVFYLILYREIEGDFVCLQMKRSIGNSLMNRHLTDALELQQEENNPHGDALSVMSGSSDMSGAKEEPEQLIRMRSKEDFASVEVRIVATMENREFVNSFTDGAQYFFKWMQEKGM